MSVLLQYEPRHHSFITLLRQLRMTLAVARTQQGWCLGVVHLGNPSEAWHVADDISHAMKRRPALAAEMRADLGLCSVRVSGQSTTLAWPAIPIEVHAEN